MDQIVPIGQQQQHMNLFNQVLQQGGGIQAVNRVLQLGENIGDSFRAVRQWSQQNRGNHLRSRRHNQINSQNYQNQSGQNRHYNSSFQGQMPKYTKRSTGGKSAGFRKRGKRMRGINKYSIKRFQKLQNITLEKKSKEVSSYDSVLTKANQNMAYGWNFPLVHKEGSQHPYELRNIWTEISSGTGKSTRTGTQIFARYMKLTIEMTIANATCPYIRIVWFKSRKGINYKLNNKDGGVKQFIEGNVNYSDGTGPFPVQDLGTCDGTDIQVITDYVLPIQATNSASDLPKICRICKTIPLMFKMSETNSQLTVPDKMPQLAIGIKETEANVIAKLNMNVLLTFTDV